MKINTENINIIKASSIKVPFNKGVLKQSLIRSGRCMNMNLVRWDYQKKWLVRLDRWFGITSGNLSYQLYTKREII
jgi:hypothetical protein